MKHQLIIDALGGCRGVASKLRLPVETVEGWRERGIPAVHWRKINQIIRERYAGGEPLPMDKALATIRDDPASMTHRTVIEALGGYRDVAAIVGVEPSTANKWTRSGIPPRWWLPIARAARARRLNGVTMDFLERCYREKYQSTHGHVGRRKGWRKRAPEDAIPELVS